MSTQPIPSTLRSHLAYPETPWRVSPDLFTRVQHSPPIGGAGGYRKCEILPTDPEHAFILEYFQASPSRNRHISKAYVIHNVAATGQFETLIPSLEQEARSKTFAPNWDKEDNIPLRKATLERWEQTTRQFSPFSIPTREDEKESYALTKVVPLWHGSKQEICHSICKAGFTSFGKHHYFKDQASGASAPKSTDLGFFGSGIYFTNSARYAADIYSDGNLLLTWVSMRTPYPVIADKAPPGKPTDMDKLEGLSAYQNYNAHYVPVVPLNPHDPQCAVYYPCSAGAQPLLDEYVVFHKTQTLSRFWIELAVDLPSAPSTSLFTTVEQMLDHLLVLLDNPSIQASELAKPLEEKTHELLTLDGQAPLSQTDLDFYKCTQKVLSEAGKVRDVIQKKLLQLTAPATQAPIAKAPPLPPAAAAAFPPPQSIAPKPSPPKPAPPVAQASQAVTLPAIAFGKAKWAQYFGDVGIEPPLPSNIEAILDSSCPFDSSFFFKKKVRETHLLVLIPKTVNGRPLTLNSLGELVQHPQQGSATGYGCYWEEAKKAHGETSIAASYWVLITKDVLPDSRSKSYADQCKLVETHRQKTSLPYEVPHVLEAATAIFLEHVQSGTRLYPDNPWTFTRCQEKAEGYQLVVGGFAPGGLDVNIVGYAHDGVGVGCVRKFC